MKTININKLRIDEDFKTFIESVRDEVDRLLNEGQEKSIPVTVKLDARWFDFSESDFPFPKQMSCIVWAAIKFGQAYFAIGDFEFTRLFNDKKRLDSLVKVRFVDALWGIEAAREQRFELLRRFDPKHQTPDDYLH